jgi:hypothetical protein
MLLTLALMLFFSSGVGSDQAQRVGLSASHHAVAEYQYMAVCTDGDGALTAWLSTFDAANNAGKQHEVSTKGHRWTVASREKPTAAALDRRGAASVGPAAFKLNNELLDAMAATSYVKPGTVLEVRKTAADCAGNACAVTSYRYDGRNLFRNNSGDRNIRVQLSNGWAGNIIDLGPGEEKASLMQMFITPYQSNYR